jgi:hypothetical protein
VISSSYIIAIAEKISLSNLKNANFAYLLSVISVGYIQCNFLVLPRIIHFLYVKSEDIQP